MAHDARQERLTAHAVHERIHRQAVDEQLVQRGAKPALPLPAVDRRRPPHVREPHDDVRSSDRIAASVRRIRQHEAEQLRQIALRRAERRELPVVRAQRQPPSASRRQMFRGLKSLWIRACGPSSSTRPPLVHRVDELPVDVRHVASSPRRECRRRMVGKRSPEIGHAGHRLGRLNEADPRAVRADLRRCRTTRHGCRRDLE